MTHSNEGPGRVLIVQCPGCETQFRFDMTLFHATPGARVRCRRCGRSIDIRNPEIQVSQSAHNPSPARGSDTNMALRAEKKAPPAAQSKAAAPSEAKAATPAAQPGPEAPKEVKGEAPPAQHRAEVPTEAKAEAPPAQFRAEVPTEAKAEAPPAQPRAEAPTEAKAATPTGARAAARNVEAGTRPPARRVAPEPQLPVERGWKRRSEIFRVEDPVGGATEARERPAISLAPYLVVAVAFLFALVAAFWYFESADRGGARKQPAVPGRGPSKTAAPKTAGYSFDRVETSYHGNSQAGLMFVLTGRVAPVQPSPLKGRIRVDISVLGADKEVIARKTVLAGAVIPDEVFLEKGREEIERAISDATGAIGSGAALPPGQPLPFQAIFFDLAGKIGAYELTAAAEP